MQNNTILLSYPRSGNTWLRYCFEVLIGENSVGYYPTANIDHSSLREIINGKKDSKPPALFKIHFFEGEEVEMNLKKNYSPIPKDYNLILLIRNYKECTIRHKFPGGAVSFKEVMKETNLNSDFPIHYMKIIENFDKSNMNKMLMYYEDLITDPQTELIKMLEFLGYDSKKNNIKPFMGIYDYHKSKSVEVYASHSPSYTKGSFISYHSKTIAIEERGNWDKKIESEYPGLFEKYLKRYKE